MALPLNDSFSIYRGDDFSRTYQIATGSVAVSTPVDLTGSAITSQVRKSENASGNPLVSFSVINRVDAEGKFTLSLSNTATASLPAGEFPFDIQITTGAGKVTTYIKGTVEVVSDVTRS